MMNLVIVLALTFILAMVLIYFIAAHDRRRAKINEQLAVMNDGSTVEPLDFKEFSKICMDICEGLKLEIKDVAHSSSEVIIRAVSQNPITQVEYLIAGFHIPRTAELDTQRILEMSDQIVSERISKGIILTTGRINIGAVRSLPELAPIEFIDGRRLMELKKELSFKY